jgi:hypothetical protein
MVYIKTSSLSSYLLFFLFCSLIWPPCSHMMRAGSEPDRVGFAALYWLYYFFISWAKKYVKLYRSNYACREVWRSIEKYEGVWKSTAKYEEVQGVSRSTKKYKNYRSMHFSPWILYKVWSKVFRVEESESEIDFSKFWVWFFPLGRDYFERLVIFYKVWWKVFGVKEWKSVIGFSK